MAYLEMRRHCKPRCILQALGVTLAEGVPGDGHDRDRGEEEQVAKIGRGAGGGVLVGWSDPVGVQGFGVSSRGHPSRSVIYTIQPYRTVQFLDGTRTVHYRCDTFRDQQSELA